MLLSHGTLSYKSTISQLLLSVAFKRRNTNMCLVLHVCQAACPFKCVPSLMPAPFPSCMFLLRFLLVTESALRKDRPQAQCVIPHHSAASLSSCPIKSFLLNHVFSLSSLLMSLSIWITVHHSHFPAVKTQNPLSHFQC